MLTEEERKIVLQENKLTGVKNSCNQSTNTLGSIRKFKKLNTNRNNPEILFLGILLRTEVLRPFFLHEPSWLQWRSGSMSITAPGDPGIYRTVKSESLASPVIDT